MFKILIVLWFIKYLVNLFTRNATVKSINKKLLDFFEKHNVNSKEKIDELDSGDKTYFVVYGFLLFILMAWKILMIIFSLILLLNMIQYDPNLITKAFIMWIMLDLLIVIIRGKFKKTNDNLLENQRETVYALNRFSFYKLVYRLGNILYWGYAIYLLYF